VVTWENEKMLAERKVSRIVNLVSIYVF